MNALLPGTIITPFVEQYLKTSYDDPEEAIENLKKRQLSGELGLPEDVANAALFLASDESKFMMGSPLYIDGGVVFGKNVFGIKIDSGIVDVEQALTDQPAASSLPQTIMEIINGVAPSYRNI